MLFADGFGLAIQSLPDNSSHLCTSQSLQLQSSPTDSKPCPIPPVLTSSATQRLEPRHLRSRASCQNANNAADDADDADAADAAWCSSEPALALALHAPA